MLFCVAGYALNISRVTINGYPYYWCCLICNFQAYEKSCRAGDSRHQSIQCTNSLNAIDEACPLTDYFLMFSYGIWVAQLMNDWHAVSSIFVVCQGNIWVSRSGAQLCLCKPLPIQCSQVEDEFRCSEDAAATRLHYRRASLVWDFYTVQS